MTQLFQTKEAIEAWLKEHEVEHYNLVPHKKYGFVVDVKGGVFLENQNLTHIPVRFGKVEGHFNCSNNQLTSLKGSPRVVKGHFNCVQNELTSLEFGPKKVELSYICSTNKLSTLEHLPITVQEKVNGVFECADNQLKSLKGCPQIIRGGFLCQKNQLTNLQYGPKEVNGDYIAENNQLSTLEFFPETVHEFLLLIGNPGLGDSQYLRHYRHLHKQHLLDVEKATIIRDKDILSNTILPVALAGEKPSFKI